MIAESILGGLAGQTAGFLGMSFLNYIWDYFGWNKVVDVNSAEYKRAVGIQQEEEALALNAQNPYNASPYAYSELNKNVAARNYFQTQQLNAASNPLLYNQNVFLDAQRRMSSQTYNDIAGGTTQLAQEGMRRFKAWNNSDRVDTKLSLNWREPVQLGLKFITQPSSGR